MRQSALLPVVAFLTLCVSAFGAQTIGEDNQIFTGLSPLPSDPYKLHSRPGAAYTIYLDFTGANPVVNSPWNAGATFTMPAYSGTAQNIKNIWMRVADAFAPFNVDVTTEPPVGGITAHKANFQRCIIGGNAYMVADPLLVPAGTVESNNWYTGGTSYLAGATTPALLAAYDEIPCFVFPDPPFVLTETQVAGAISHQLGHVFGLEHKGIVNTVETEWALGRCSKDGRFYFGHGADLFGDPGKKGADAKSWGPIMGLPVYGQNRQSWVSSWYAVYTLETYTYSVGTRVFTGFDYTDNSSNRTDEMVVLTGVLGAANVAPAAGEFIPGSSVGLPTSLAVAGGTFLKGGIQHSFAFMANPGPIAIKVQTIQPVGVNAPLDTMVVSNLKVSLSLSDEHGKVLYSGVQGTFPEQGAEIKFTALKTGIYRLTITSVGSDGTTRGGSDYKETPYVTSFPDRVPVGNLGKDYDCYASAGKYSLVGAWTAPTYANPNPTVTTGAAGPVAFGSTVNFVGTASSPNIGNNGLFTYTWDFGDSRSPDNVATNATPAATSNVSHVYKAPGTYTARLFAKDSFGKKSLAATKVIVVTGTLPAALKVGSITATAWRRVNSVSKGATATINVIDQYGLPIDGAVAVVNVNGTVAGKPVNYNVSVKTNFSGSAVVTTSKYPLPSTGSLTFTVASITPPTKLKAVYPKAIAPAGGSLVSPVMVVN